MQVRLSQLAQVIASTPSRHWCGPFDPEQGADAWRFYLFCMVQQCGAGLTTANDTLSCGQLWNLYFENWRGSRDIFRTVSFQEFTSFIVPDNATWRITPGRIFTRFLLHNDAAAYGDDALGNLDEISALNSDPYRKRLNLIKNALYQRPERFVAEEGGPVIDYHVMRVFLRYLDLPLTGDELHDEALLREQAWQCAWQLYNDFGLSHDQIDGFLWLLGRNVCRYEAPECLRCPLASTCAKAEKKEPRIETFFY